MFVVLRNVMLPRDFSKTETCQNVGLLSEHHTITDSVCVQILKLCVAFRGNLPYRRFPDRFEK